MAFNGHLVIAGLLTLIAVLYQLECNSARWRSTEEALFISTPEKLARFITNTDVVGKWFQWVSNFKEADSRPISQGKKYRATYNIPIYGEYVMLFRLTQCTPNKLYVLESDNLLKPQFVIKLVEDKDKNTKVTLSLEFHRTSALYHMTLGPVFWFLSSQQLRQSLLILRMIFPF